MQFSVIPRSPILFLVVDSYPTAGECSQRILSLTNSADSGLGFVKDAEKPTK